MAAPRASFSMAQAFEVFRAEGRWDNRLILLFALICTLLLANAFLHDPTGGYDAGDHVAYVKSLAAHWRLPTRAETAEYYSAPLPYVLPATLTALHFGLWKALKIAQFFNVLLAVGLLYYLLKICELVSPARPRLKLLAITLCGMLPVFYRSFAFLRGEPFLAFLAVFIVYECLVIFTRHDNALRNWCGLALALGLSIFARQWGFFLFPPVLIFALWSARRGQRVAVLSRLFAAFAIAVVIGGWFYVFLYMRDHTWLAYDRPPQPLNEAQASAVLGLDASSSNVFIDPVRPSLGSSFFPIMYADTWGDYSGYFLIYARSRSTGDFKSGDFFQKNAAPSAVPADIDTNRYEINHYLAALGILAIVPTALLLCGLLMGCLLLSRFVLGRPLDDRGRASALFAMIAGISLVGYLWFVLRYQNAYHAGDLIKSTYVLQAFPAVAFLGAAFTDSAWDRRPRIWHIAGMLLAMTFVVALPAFVTHYVHLSLSGPAIAVLGSSILFLGGLALTYWIHTRYVLDVVAELGPRPNQGPLISLCVPARNEQTNIRECIQALLAQTYPNFELIVLDDRSTDATAQLLQELSSDRRLRVLHGEELPAGWAGKPHALAQAAAAARGDWLCFVDADTFLAPGALAACYARAIATGADMFTMLTRQLTGTFWEKVIMPVVMTALSVGFPPREVNDPKSRVTVANGQFILIKRSVYDVLGGHARIRDRIVEDKALAELVKWNGYRLILADGRQVARTRMYRSFPQMWEGWTKNIFLGLRDQPQLIFLGAFGAFLLVLSALFLPAWPLLGLSWYMRGGGWLAVMVVIQALLTWTAVLFARAGVAHAMRISRWYALTLPLGAGVFATMMLVSAWKVISGQGVTWRGRKYTPAASSKP